MYHKHISLCCFNSVAQENKAQGHVFCLCHCSYVEQYERGTVMFVLCLLTWFVCWVSSCSKPSSKIVGMISLLACCSAPAGLPSPRLCVRSVNWQGQHRDCALGACWEEQEWGCVGDGSKSIHWTRSSGLLMWAWRWAVKGREKKVNPEIQRNLPK